MSRMPFNPIPKSVQLGYSPGSKKRKPYRFKVGKVGRANSTANRKIAELWKEKAIFFCEIMVDKYVNETRRICVNTGFPGLQNVHRHKRHWYRNRLHLLYDYTQVARGCHYCHSYIESKSELTEKIFMEIRGDEKIS